MLELYVMNHADPTLQNREPLFNPEYSTWWQAMVLNDSQEHTATRAAIFRFYASSCSQEAGNLLLRHLISPIEDGELRTGAEFWGLYVPEGKTVHVEELLQVPPPLGDLGKISLIGIHLPHRLMPL